MLTHCTFTGVDASTDLGHAKALAAEFPNTEFGLLFSRTAAGVENRYPTPAELERIVGDFAGARGVNLALHICGKAVADFVARGSALRDLASGFGRVQLNFTLDRIRFSVGELDNAIHEFGRPVITQDNQANHPITSALTAANHQVLFDTSGGRGIRSDAWPAPIHGKLCGYAGGIGPQTIAGDLVAADRAAGHRDHWIDMESKVRTPTDLFDLSVVEQCLKVVHGKPAELAPA